MGSIFPSSNMVWCGVVSKEPWTFWARVARCGFGKHGSTLIISPLSYPGRYRSKRFSALLLGTCWADWKGGPGCQDKRRGYPAHGLTTTATVRTTTLDRRLCSPYHPRKALITFLARCRYLALPSLQPSFSAFLSTRRGR